MASRTLADCDKELHREFQKARAEFETLYPDAAVEISATYRSPEEQFKLFKIGRREERPGVWVKDELSRTPVVTFLDGKHKLSKHNCYPAHAVDFYIELYGKVTWELKWYQRMGHICKSHGLLWGGDFKMVDGPHVELPGPQPKKGGR